MTILGLFLNKEMRTGANRRYLELLEGLAEKQNNVIVIMNSLLEYTPVHFKKIEICIPYTRKGIPPASYLFSIKARLIETLIHEKIDWILIHGDLHLSLALTLKNKLHTKLFFAYRCNNVLRAQLVRRSRTISFCENISSCFFELLYRMREKKVAQYSDLITFQSKSDCIDYIKRTQCSEHKTVVIPGNIGLPRFSADWQNKNTSVEVKTLLYVGVLSSSKGLHYVLRALALLKNKGYTNLLLKVLGKKDNAKDIFRMVEKLGIKEQVSFEGYKQPFSYLASCDLMVFPSIYDAFPDTVLEALHVGCPVIAANSGGIPDMLNNTQLLFDASNVQDIANRIERCITDTEYYNSIRNLCAIQAEKFRFDWVLLWQQSMNNYKNENITQC